MRRGEDEGLPESDAFPEAPHPRHAQILVGHRPAEAEMLASYREGRLAHAWLITGAEGIGKATLAWRFTKFLLANPNPTGDSVRAAHDLSVDPNRPVARQLAALAHPDFSLIRREWRTTTKNFATEIGVDVVRAAMQIFHLSAAFGGWRVCIVDCAEDLNRNSANALLKMIEEPPQRALILIVSHRPGQVLPTIRSRCRRLKLDLLSEREIAEVVASLGPPWSEAAQQAVANAARRASGSVREALTRLSPESKGVGGLIDSIIAGLPRPDPRAVFKLAEALAGRSAEEAYQTFHRELYDWFASYAARTASSSIPAEELGALWDRIRQAARETEALNLDRKLYVLTIFIEIAATARLVDPRR
jgi:DNA polymerase III subunit delta'